MKNKKLLQKLRLMAPAMPTSYKPPFLEEKPKAPDFPADLATFKDKYRTDGGTLVNFLLHNPATLWAVPSLGPENKSELLAQAQAYDNGMAVWGHNYSRWSQRTAIYSQAHWANFWATTMLEAWEEMDMIEEMQEDEKKNGRDMSLEELLEETPASTDAPYKWDLQGDFQQATVQHFNEGVQAMKEAPALLVTTVEVLPLAPADVIEKRAGEDHPNYPFQDDPAKIQRIAADELRHGNRAWE